MKKRSAALPLIDAVINNCYQAFIKLPADEDRYTQRALQNHVSHFEGHREEGGAALTNGERMRAGWSGAAFRPCS